MASDEQLLERVRDALTKQKADFTEKRMFGGVCFLVKGKMCVCVSKTRLMVRLDPELYDEDRRTLLPTDTGLPFPYIVGGVSGVSGSGLAAPLSALSEIDCRPLCVPGDGE